MQPQGGAGEGTHVTGTAGVVQRRFGGYDTNSMASCSHWWLPGLDTADPFPHQKGGSTTLMVEAGSTCHRLARSSRTERRPDVGLGLAVGRMTVSPFHAVGH